MGHHEHVTSQHPAPHWSSARHNLLDGHLLHIHHTTILSIGQAMSDATQPYLPLDTPHHHVTQVTTSYWPPSTLTSHIPYFLLARLLPTVTMGGHSAVGVTWPSCASEGGEGEHQLSGGRTTTLHNTWPPPRQGQQRGVEGCSTTLEWRIRG